jgi:hypothetical protein
MAMAGHAQLERLTEVGVRTGAAVSARELLKNGYYWSLAAIGAGLIVLVRPVFDFSPWAVFAAVIVAAFLVIMERPQSTYHASTAPLAAVLAAATVSLGWWSLPLAIAGWVAVQWRLHPEKPTFSFVNVLAGQIGVTTIAVYAMMGVYSAARLAVADAPHLASSIIWLFGIIAIGMTWQIVNNASVTVALFILGKPGILVRYWRAGFVASLWAYLLVAMYAFSGILGAVVFYVAVAHTRMFDRILSVVEAADEHDWIVTQFYGVIRDLYNFMSPADVEFAADVRYISLQLARKLGLPKTEIENIGLAAEFHELGKCQLAAKLRTTADLTPAETRERMRYPALGAKILRKASRLIPEEVSYAVEHQCEAFDGSGRPHGMRGTRIPVAARILAVSHDYVQLLTGHDGVKVHARQDALKSLLALAGTQYDPSLVDLLQEQIA